MDYFEWDSPGIKLICCRNIKCAMMGSGVVKNWALKDFIWRQSGKQMDICYLLKYIIYACHAVNLLSSSSRLVFVSEGHLMG